VTTTGVAEHVAAWLPGLVAYTVYVPGASPFADVTFPSASFITTVRLMLN